MEDVNADPRRSSGYVAKRFGVAVSTVRYWVEVEYIKPDGRTPGGHMRFRMSEIERFEQWLEQNPKNRGSKSGKMAPSTSTGTTPSESTSAVKVWTPAIISRQSQGSQSSSSKDPTTPSRAEAFLD
ncbi:MerR family DNA-binding transcriptional regulator [Bradyrhizobium neotropicale]|nr:MerR family DNA-binding transcriptional regulator [Bradyrhizobium neotropicale]